MFIPLIRREVLQDADHVMPPWATVAIALIIFAIFMIIVGVICHRFGCLGSSPSPRTTPITSTTTTSTRYASYTPPPSRRVSETQATQPHPQRHMRRKERPMSQTVGLTSSETVNRAMLHPPPPAYTPSAPRSLPAPIAPVIEKGYGSLSGSRVSRNTSKSSTQFPIMNN